MPTAHSYRRSILCVRRLLFLFLSVALLAMIILLPPASSPLRTRVYNYHREEVSGRHKHGIEESRLPEVLALTDAVPICPQSKCDLAMEGQNEERNTHNEPYAENAKRIDTGRGAIEVELTVFVVFHRMLYAKLYNGLDWSALLPMAPHSPSTPHAAGANHTSTRLAELQSYRESDARQNGTRLLFLATREWEERLLMDAPPLAGRVLRVWEMRGYKPTQRFLNMYNAILTVYRSGLTSNVRHGVQSWVAFLEYDMSLDQRVLRSIRRRIFQPQPLTKSTRRCCIFYGVSYNTVFLLHNRLGRRLLEEYNAFFGVDLALGELPLLSPTGAFVLPAPLLQRVAPFLERVAERLVANRSAYRFNETSTAVAVMEAAMALSLGMEREYARVEVPIRHMTEREIEELDDADALAN